MFSHAEPVRRGRRVLALRHALRGHVRPAAALGVRPQPQPDRADGSVQPADPGHPRHPRAVTDVLRYGWRTTRTPGRPPRSCGTAGRSAPTVERPQRAASPATATGRGRGRHRDTDERKRASESGRSAQVAGIAATWRSSTLPRSWSRGWHKSLRNGHKGNHNSKIAEGW
jgi:hypothetical protein